MTRAPYRRRTGEALPRAEIFGDLITADHKVLSEGCEYRNNLRYAVVVQDLATQWIQSYPCKNKTSQETERSLQKFLEPTRKPKVIYTDNSLGIWQSLWRSFLESLYVNTTQIGNTWDCWESSTQSEGRYVCGTVAIRSGCKMVGWFFGMLLLSSKCPRPLGRLENSVWKTIWRTIQRASNSLWSNGWISSDFNERPVKSPLIWQERLTRNIPRICIGCGGIWKGDILVADIEEQEEIDASEIYPRRINAKEAFDDTKKRWIHIPSSRWNSKIVRERPRIPRNPL